MESDQMAASGWILSLPFLLWLCDPKHQRCERILILQFRTQLLMEYKKTASPRLEKALDERHFILRYKRETGFELTDSEKSEFAILDREKAEIGFLRTIPDEAARKLQNLEEEEKRLQKRVDALERKFRKRIATPVEIRELLFLYYRLLWLSDALLKAHLEAD